MSDGAVGTAGAAPDGDALAGDGTSGDGAVGIVVNPIAGTDVRRLTAPAGHVSNAARIAIVERAATAALEAGASRVLVADDAGGLGRRAVQAIDDVRVELLDEPATGTRHDTVAACRRFWKASCGAVVVLGGDGTCRDAAIGWPGLPLVALSTGTNNVFPRSIDAVAAGTAAALVAARRVPLDAVASAAKRLVVHAGAEEHVALVDLAVVDAPAIGARAVLDAAQVRAVVAVTSTPSASGLSSIAGRVAPLADDDPDGVIVHLERSGRSAPAGDVRRVRVPLVPGSFATVQIAAVQRLARGAAVTFAGPAVLAFDGERDVRVEAGVTITVTVDDGGPLRIDVDRALRLGAERRAYDLQPPELPEVEDPDGH